MQHVHLALSYNSNESNVRKLADDLVSEYGKAHPDRVRPIISYHQADLSNVEETLRLCDEAKREHGHIVDILIANAGFGKRITDIE